MLAPEDFKAHWAEGVPNDVYHADRTSVSSTGLRRLLKSPKTFKAALDGPPIEPTEAMKFGTLVHHVILEGADFLKRYVVAPEFVGLTKDGRESKQSASAKAKRDEWHTEQILAGNVIVEQKEFDDVRGMLDSVLLHQDAFALLKNGVTEVSGYYRDPETGILCRLRPDYISMQHMVIVDLKTTRSVEEEEFSKAIWNYRYDFQIAMYGEGAEQICQRKVDYHAFIAVEKEPPYECAVYLADEAMLEKGQQDYHRSLRILRQCIDAGHWPRYQKNMKNIALPHWALREY